MTSTRIARPVGAKPMYVPSFVPVATLRVHTRSPATVRSSMASRKSGKARCKEAMTAFTPAGPGACWGP